MVKKFAPLLVAAAVLAIDTAASASDQDDPDCGTNALYTIMKLRDANVSITDIRRTLPARAEGGYSLKELRDAAGKLGFSLRGTKLGRDDPLPDPALVYLKRGHVGHFLVIRSVGHTGRLLQSIDQEWDAQVHEKAAFMASDDWTGLALVPSYNLYYRASAYIIMALAVLIGYFWIIAMLRKIPAMRWPHRRRAGDS